LGSDWQAEARPTKACPRGGRGWETGDCDFDAETRRRGDKRREAAKSKRGRARRQQRMVAFGEKRTGFRRGSAEFHATDGVVVERAGQPESVILTRRHGDSGGGSPSVRSGRVSGEKTF